MKNYTRLLTLLLALFMLLQTSTVSAFAFAPIEISTDILSASGQPSVYSDEYNSGQRHVVATTLNGTSADSYYNGSYEYDVLSEQSASSILSALRNLMTSTHNKNSSYEDCWNYADNADCENENGKVVLIYTNVTTTLSNKNSGWNREHVWPKSLGGYETSGPGADLHHIRPSDNRVNSCRNNLKYGNVSGGKTATGGNAASGIDGGTYNSTYFEPHDNVKGDVARICLYMYVRYGGSWSKCSSITNVFQSVDVLLEWCEIDPVDTWELGRNEVVGAYQGNRNVFIDYPEYAWLIFGKEVPEDMTTPSGEAKSNAHSWDNGTITTEPTCTTAGVKTYTCSDCNKTKTETISALGHSWSSGSVTTEATCTTTGTKTFTCSRCNGTKTETIKALGHNYGDWIIDSEATETTTGEKHRVCGNCNETETLTIPILGHEHNYTSVVTAPTCKEEGYTTHTCACGDYYVDSYRDLINHKYEDGACTMCGIADPSAPASKPEDFTNCMTKLISGIYSGEEKYNKIREALIVYNALSDTNKTAVSAKYELLKGIIAEYNNTVNSMNSDADNASKALVSGSIIDVSALYFAVYQLFGKKYI